MQSGFELVARPASLQTIFALDGSWNIFFLDKIEYLERRQVYGLRWLCGLVAWSQIMRRLVTQKS